MKKQKQKDMSKKFIHQGFIVDGHERFGSYYDEKGYLVMTMDYGDDDSIEWYDEDLTEKEKDAILEEATKEFEDFKREFDID